MGGVISQFEKEKNTNVYNVFSSFLPVVQNILIIYLYYLSLNTQDTHYYVFLKSFAVRHYCVTKHTYTRTLSQINKFFESSDLHIIYPVYSTPCMVPKSVDLVWFLDDYVCVCVCQSLSRVSLFATQWTVACQAPLSMEFSRQGHWSGLPLPSPGDLPSPVITPGSAALQVHSLPFELPGRPG